jgi:hypothetical protein
MPYDSDVDSQSNTSQNQILLLLLKLTLMSGLGMQRLLASGVFQFHGANIDGTSTGFHTFMCYRVKSIYIRILKSQDLQTFVKITCIQFCAKVEYATD